MISLISTLIVVSLVQQGYGDQQQKIFLDANADIVKEVPFNYFNSHTLFGFSGQTKTYVEIYPQTEKPDGNKGSTYEAKLWVDTDSSPVEAVFHGPENFKPVSQKTYYVSSKDGTIQVEIKVYAVRESTFKQYVGAYRYILKDKGFESSIYANAFEVTDVPANFSVGTTRFYAFASIEVYIEIYPDLKSKLDDGNTRYKANAWTDAKDPPTPSHFDGPDNFQLVEGKIFKVVTNDGLKEYELKEFSVYQKKYNEFKAFHDQFKYQ